LITYDFKEFENEEELQKYIAEHPEKKTLPVSAINDFFPETTENVMKFLDNLKNEKENGNPKKKNKKSESDTQEKIKVFLSNMTELLLEKNKNYGDSTNERKQFFSAGITPLGGILIRIDDKLSRILKSLENGDPVKNLRRDDIFDLLGYLTLLVCRMEKETGDPLWLDPRTEID
jgi:hypothetical protein